jgi:hypothetical protein
MFYYYLFISAFYIGFFKLPDSMRDPLFDSFFLIMTVFTVLSWKKPLKYDRSERLVIIAWTVFIVYFAIMAISSEKAFSKISSIFNIRALYGYVLFYFTIAIVDNKQKLITTVKFFVFLSVIGSIITFIQSVYGPDPMFDPTGIYNIGHWGGQGGLMIGPMARVLLPSMYLIYIVFIALILFYFLKNKLSNLLLLFVLAVSILISYTRSFWMATAITILITISIFIRNSLITKTSFYLSFLTILVFIGIVSFLMSLDNPISTSLNERFMSIFVDVSNNSGTFGFRLLNLQRYLGIWQTHGFFLGVDPFFVNHFEEPELTDVGFVYVLVTLGLIGLILLINIWISGIIFAISSIQTGVKLKNLELVLAGATLFATIILFIIAQVYTQFSFTVSLLSLILGLTIASKRILHD